MKDNKLTFTGEPRRPGGRDPDVCVLTCALTGVLANRRQCPSIPYTPAEIADEAKQAGLPESIALPTESVAGKTIDTGAEARTFAQYMRIHTLMATGGYTYSQMGRFQAKPDTPKAELAVGGGTDNAIWAATDPKTQQPISNHARDIWVTETALTTALNASYMADQISLFGLMVGITLLLTGLGFGILAVGGALRNEESPLRVIRKKEIAKHPVPTT